MYPLAKLQFQYMSACYFYGVVQKAAFLPFSSILFSLYLYPLWSVSSKAFWTSHNSAFSRWSSYQSLPAGACPAGLPRPAERLLRSQYIYMAIHLSTIVTHCSKSSFFVQNSTLISRQNCRFHLGEKLVKMLWFWPFQQLTTLISREKLSKKFG